MCRTTACGLTRIPGFTAVDCRLNYIRPTKSTFYVGNLHDKLSTKMCTLALHEYVLGLAAGIIIARLSLTA